MDKETIIALAKAGFSAEEIKVVIGPDAFATDASVLKNSDPSETSIVKPSAQKTDADQPAPVPIPEQAAAEAPAAAPAQAPEGTAPKWFSDFAAGINNDIADLQRALQVQNVRRAEGVPGAKTQEQLMAEAFRAIVD